MQHPHVVFFDGICHLCNGFVDFIITRDPSHRYHFAPLQGPTAQEMLPPADLKDVATVIYFENGQLHHRSTAVLKILVGLGGFYRLWALARVIPPPLRDLVYKYVARHRYAWFGEREFCRLPGPAEKEYLLP